MVKVKRKGWSGSPLYTTEHRKQNERVAEANKTAVEVEDDDTWAIDDCRRARGIDDLAARGELKLTALD